MTALPVSASVPEWGGRAVERLRVYFRTQLPQPCGECGETVTTADRWVIGHTKDRATYPELTWVLSNMRVEHKRCSDSTGQGVALRRAHDAGRAAALRELAAADPDDSPSNPSEDVRSRFSGEGGASGSRRTFPDTYAERPEVRRFDPSVLASCDWLADLLDKPDDASWPFAMSGPHPDAVGSYGLAAEEWARSQLGVELRWWQRLALRRQLEHDADGRLVWTQIVESTPRRAGKSVRLRMVALWRIAHSELLGETQLVVFTGKDLPIAKEIHRQAWRWAEARGWDVKRQNGNEEIETPDESRWIVRGRTSVYGYDVCLGQVDEAWGVEPSVVDEGLEPAIMERMSPQIHLTSTAHRRATSLMRRRIDAALSGIADETMTLLMIWAADRDADPTDPVQWRLASPHWSEDRERLIRSKLDRAVRGEADPDADDPDPMEGFRAQYLNIWPLADKPREAPGEPAFQLGEWTTLVGRLASPEPAPVVAGIESWFSEGIALARAWLVDGLVYVSVDEFKSLRDALSMLTSSTSLLVGKSLATDPLLQSYDVEPIGGTTRQAVTTLRTFVDEDVVRHDGGEFLTSQMLDVRVVPSPDGPRVKSSTRADALKAASWVIERARRLPEIPQIF